jgi:hypothetical protein
MSFTSIIFFVLVACTYARLELRAVDDSSFVNEATTPKENRIAIVTGRNSLGQHAAQEEGPLFEVRDCKSRFGLVY